MVLHQSGWPSGLRRQFKALVFGRGFESHTGQLIFASAPCEFRLICFFFCREQTSTELGNKKTHRLAGARSLLLIRIRFYGRRLRRRLTNSPDRPAHYLYRPLNRAAAVGPGGPEVSTHGSRASRPPASNPPTCTPTCPWRHRQDRLPRPAHRSSELVGWWATLRQSTTAHERVL